MVYDLLTITSRMEEVRAHHGRRLGITGPQYSVVIAIAHLQGDDGVSVGTVAQTLHVSSAFIAVETGKLARRGFVVKHPNPRDGRGVLLSITPAGRAKLSRLSGEIQAVNDLFFGSLDAKSFAGLCAAAARLVEGSRKAMHYLAAIEDFGRCACRNRRSLAMISYIPRCAHCRVAKPLRTCEYFAANVFGDRNIS